MKLKKHIKPLIIILTLLLSIIISQGASADVKVYRLFNSNSLEHLYTKDSNEVNTLTKKNGFISEGTAWIAPSSGKPVYRLYNPKSGEHMYTENLTEKKALQSSGWSVDGTTFNSGGNVPVYRLYAPKGSVGQQHLWTTDNRERQALLKTGVYKDEGVAWYAVKAGVPLPAPITNISNLKLTPNNPYPSGQCTAYVWQYFYTNLKKTIPTYAGNAGDWTVYANSKAATNTIAVFPPGNQGASAFGHVAFVKTVNSNGTITIVEGNFNNGWGTTRTVSTAGVYFIKP